MNEAAFRDLTYGMFLVGVTKEGKATGCIANTVVQVSQDPPVLSVSLNNASYTAEVLKESGLCCVNVLAQTAPAEVVARFGTQSGRTADKFEGLDYIPTPDDLPILEEGVCGWFECKVRETVALPGATLFLLDVFDGDRLGDRISPMTYAYYQMALKGGVPKSAPGHRIPEDEGGPPAGPKYVCSLCGYEYDGSQGPFEFLPPTWTCPNCGAPKSAFVIKE